MELNKEKKYISNGQYNVKPVTEVLKNMNKIIIGIYKNNTKYSQLDSANLHHQRMQDVTHTMLIISNYVTQCALKDEMYPGGHCNAVIPLGHIRC